MGLKQRMIFGFIITMAALSASAADRGVAVKPKPGDGKERRTALVIGNSTYLVSPLRNPANDAKLMAKTLRDLGFTVDERTNLSQGQMKQAIEDFGRSIKQGGVGLFYYAGHGMQVNGRNYLIPVDADIQGEAEVDIKAVDAGAVMAKMEMAQNNMNIVILDACRNNPFSRSFRAANPGLASMNAPSGTLIAYATAPGSVASDGTGQNGLYTEQLVGNMKKPGVKIEDMFKQVRSGVQGRTQGKQIPWESSSLTGDFYFSGAGGASRLPELEKGSKERQAELERLKKLEAEDAKKKQQEQAEIAKKEKELAELDALIASMKSRLGSGAAGADDSLDKMLAMVKQKEDDARKIETLRKQREAEEAKRQAEIQRLKKEAETKRKAEIEADIAKFEAIANSPYGKDMAPTAWKSLTRKYASLEGVEAVAEGDSASLREVLLETGYTEPELGMKFVEVKGGCFQMGSSEGRADEQPLHEVCVDDYYIGRFEVTQDQWQKVMGSNPSEFKQCGGNCPVESVSWNDIKTFLRKLNDQNGKKYRLPTEAEWEYAARSGGKDEKFAGVSDDDDLHLYANFCDASCTYDHKDKNQSDGVATTAPVGRFRPNGLGIYDMSGNVWEWCSDWYDENYYKNSPRNNPQGPASGKSRLLRGGSWSRFAYFTRAATRVNYFPGNRDNNVGFRLARTK